MQTLTVKEFMSAKAFAQVTPIIRTNTNGYPFLTFTSDANEAENIYFSKNMQVTAGPTTIEFLRGLKVCNTVNATGESRWKLTDSAGVRIDLADL